MKKDREHTDRCDAVLVRGVNWIGDAVMTIPALRSIKRSAPGSTVSLLVKPWVAPLFEKDPAVDEIILYTDEFKGVSGKLKLARKLKARGFCLAMLFQNAFEAALLAVLAGIPQRMGYKRDGRGLLLTHPVDFDAHTRNLHHIDYYLNLTKRAGFDAIPGIPWIFLGIEERLKARDMLASLKRPVVAINPGATYGSSKRWHPRHFAEVAAGVMRELGGSVVLLGGPKETGITDEILSSADPALITSESLLNLSGRTSLRALIAVISECDVLLTNDSGPMHIGYAVGTPVVAIFGSTSPEHTGPAGASDIEIRKTVACAPCFERECRKKDLDCMERFNSPEVFGAVKKLVSTKRAVFFDRDGTLCKDAHYLARMEDFEIFPSIAGLERLREKGFSLIGITNQSGIARGLVQEEFARKINQIFKDQYGFEDFYYCPHHPDDHCSCRKPEPGMLLRARNEHGIDLKRSVVVGDKHDDMVLARVAGAKGVLVRTGKAQSSQYADAVVDGLDDAVRVILSMDEKGDDA
ncbi:MAG: lipopolysaccharide heptosyltransferase II [Nitrospirae bacterium]|nr:lipopolysaccharide heptosyltransferase II [Nitrospirota bacterium]